METPTHTIQHLFAQLGQASDEAAISAFIQTHRPLPPETQLHEASFWSASQATFLWESISQDADWAEVIDALNTELH